MLKFINERGWHPVGLGLAVYTLTLIIFNVLDAGVISNDVLADALVAIGAVAFASICAGWATRSSRMLGVGFLSVGFLVVTRSVFLGIDHGWDAIGVWLGLAVGIIAVGSYVKEGHAHQREWLDDAGT